MELIQKLGWEGKTTQNSKPFQIAIHLMDLGGYGDIIAAVNLGVALQKQGYQINIIPPNTILSDGKIAEEKFMDITNGNERGWPITNAKSIRGQPIISICPIRDSRSKEEKRISKHNLTVREYGNRGLAGDNSNFVISTGIDFDQDQEEIQAGVYFPENAKELIKKIEGNDKTELKKEVINEVKEGFGTQFLEDVVNEQWCVYYPSSLSSKYHFFDILHSALPNIDKNITVFTFNSSDDKKDKLKKKLGMLGKSCRYLHKATNAIDKLKKKLSMLSVPFRYLCKEKEGIEEYQLREGQPRITVLDLGTVSNSLFQKILMLSDLPSVVTGDQSLSEMLLKGQSSLATPFFYHTAPWKRRLTKSIIQKLEKSNMEIAEIFLKYIQNEECPLDSIGLKKRGVEDEARLFYDKELINQFNQTIKAIPEQIIQERKNAQIQKCQELTSVEDTISYIIEELKNGSKPEEIKKSLTKEVGE